ncbi:MAG: NADH:ubiquinone reductase (Na(+)-transporting) subunit C [Bacteroidetes bacterium]|nr:MAG: NADH:ubiquinone reductase (Na(+)-transporting) subunit C [Bacteroidota bacterium]
MSNRYVFMYASVMVIVVALVLSTAATLLRPLQERNMRIEKMQNILSTIEISAPKGEAIELFEQYITQTKVINHLGEEIEGDAFEVDLQDENRKPIEERQLPLFIANVDGELFYIIPLRGNGLWGPIWGYLSFRGDLTTIAGANFDHASETPGLGAEIADPPFERQFVGKRIFDEDGEFKPVVVVKGGAPSSDDHAVDGISGGTITSNGVTAMIRNGLQLYKPYFLKQKTS